MKVEDKIALGKLGRSRLVLNNKPVVSYKPVVRPRINYNKPKLIINSRPSYNKPSVNNKPSFNSKPSYNSKPSINNSRPVVTRGVKKGN